MECKCPKCQSSNAVGPFEMDGNADGEYHAEGLCWIVCRECGRTSRVHIIDVDPDEVDEIARAVAAAKAQGAYLRIETRRHAGARA